MSTRRHIAITFAAKYIELGLGFVSSVILARLLTPEDFGIYSIAASLVLIGYLFRNFGVGQFIVQVDELDDDILRAAFALTLMVSWTIGVGLLLLAPWAGAFYGNGGVTAVLRFLSLNFFLLPFGAITDAVLRRNLAFDKLAIMAIAAAAAALVVGVGAAWLGARYLAIAWAANASTLTTILLTLLFRPRGLPWRPGIRGMRRVFAFGVKVGSLDVINQGSDAATEMVVGKAFSLHDLGIYSRAYGAFMLFEYAFVEGVRPVVLPYLSEARRGQADLGEIYRQIIAYATILMVPFFTVLGLVAEDVILALYGDQWLASAPLLSIMCVAGGLLSLTVFFDQLLIAKGLPGQALSYQSIAQALRLGALLALATGRLEWTAGAVAVGALARAALVLRLAKRHFALAPVRLLGTLIPAAGSALAVATLVMAVDRLLEGSGLPLLRLAAVGVVAGMAWVAAIFFSRHPLSDEIRRLLRRTAA